MSIAPFIRSIRRISLRVTALRASLLIVLAGELTAVLLRVDLGAVRLDEREQLLFDVGGSCEKALVARVKQGIPLVMLVPGTVLDFGIGDGNPANDVQGALGNLRDLGTADLVQNVDDDGGVFP